MASVLGVAVAAGCQCMSLLLKGNGFRVAGVAVGQVLLLHRCCCCTGVAVEQVLLATIEDELIEYSAAGEFSFAEYGAP